MSCEGAPHTGTIPPESETTDIMSRYRTVKCSNQLPLVNNLPSFCDPDAMQMMLMTTDPKCLEGNVECDIRFLRHQPPPCWNWSRMEVDDWLIQAGYGRYRKMFHDLNIDGRKLAESGAHDFRRMGFRNWKDCKDIAEAAKKVTGREIHLNPDDYKHKIYPYHPGLYVCHETCRPPVTDADSQKSEVSRKKDVFRHVYKSADGQCFYFDGSKPHY